ncbi:hypothetical protein SMACR_08935 [Sordaria macrospora]|uniref:WGS project CABT00000000 data, contig 2.70 n=2 Tax=Sordaria macrospora TaxID=5147 RepID=F7WB57_SORMK|nr:uncharacterized protein SMAC_08935 [Sordaria macrospora k-hell]KAA8631100.1 hypothetical protein SMACR_08935 [Sordaria macrospora]WPJ63935.1 hypothetical protein SMAC4_08935 [Sordaria macrospora]CCC14349.1 unnamed protein product [Sordaria macrospora k-hell]
MDDETSNNPIVKLTPSSQYLAPCPKFRVLVMGNPESTKQELFSKVFGVDLEKKLVADAFSPTHDINTPLDLEGQNEHLEIFTSPNFFSPTSSTSFPSSSFESSSESSSDPSYTLASTALRTVSSFIASRTSLSQIGSVAPDVITSDNRLHAIWYCVSSADTSRPISPVESYFFHHLSQIVPHHVPVLLLFTKYDEFVSQVQMDWIKSAQEKGMSKVAVAHILRDLVTKKFEDTIGRKWDGLLKGVDGGLKERRDSGFGYGGSDRKDMLYVGGGEREGEGRRQREVVRVLVGGGGESEQDWGGEPAWGEELSGEEEGGYGELVKRTLGGLRESKEVRRVFAAAQRCLAGVSSEFAANLASTYFEVDTSHARKLHGVDVRDIMPNFFAKAVQLFNLRDVSCVLDLNHNPSLLIRILEATFGPHQRVLVDESLSHSSTDPGHTIFLGLSPHERAVMLAQAMAAVILFLHKLADIQWPHRDNSRGILPPATITSRQVQHVIDEIELGTEKRDLLEEIEGSSLFTSCRMRKEVADLICKAVEKADESAASHFSREESRGTFMVDDSDLQEISLAFVNDKGPDDMVLPNGLRILPLN